MKPPISSVTRKHREDVIFCRKKSELSTVTPFLAKKQEGSFFILWPRYY